MRCCAIAYESRNGDVIRKPNTVLSYEPALKSFKRYTGFGDNGVFKNISQCWCNAYVYTLNKVWSTLWRYILCWIFKWIKYFALGLFDLMYTCILLGFVNKVATTKCRFTEFMPFCSACKTSCFRSALKCILKRKHLILDRQCRKTYFKQSTVFNRWWDCFKPIKKKTTVIDSDRFWTPVFFFFFKSNRNKTYTVIIPGFYWLFY